MQLNTPPQPTSSLPVIDKAKPQHEVIPKNIIELLTIFTYLGHGDTIFQPSLFEIICSYFRYFQKLPMN